MRCIAFLLVLPWLTTVSLAQQQAFVYLDYAENTLNGGQALPAYQDILLVGAVSEQMNMVEVQILPKGEPYAEPLYRTRWKNPPDTQPEMFKIALDYQLRPGKTYDFKFQYYSILTDRERADLIRLVLNQLSEVIYDATEAQKLGIGKAPTALIPRLNATVLNQLKRYRPQTEVPWEGFSDLVVQKLNDLEALESLDSLNDIRQEIYEQRRTELLRSLEDVVQREALQYVDQPMALLVDARYVSGVRVQRSNSTFGLSAGYVWVYLEGQLDDDLRIDAAPYVGLSFSPSNPEAAPFLRKGSLHAGFFLTRLKRHPRKEYTGPAFDRPIYLGLDYKIYRWLRFSAGGVLLQEDNMNGEQPLLIRPFVGLGMRFQVGASIEE